jgi:hypothetical protein
MLPHIAKITVFLHLSAVKISYFLEEKSIIYFFKYRSVKIETNIAALTF